MPMTEDFELFFDAEEHGTEVLLDGVAVVGIVQRPYLDVAGMATTAPLFVCPADEAAGVEEGSTLVYGATSYTVRDPKPDGTGLIRMTLEAA